MDYEDLKRDKEIRRENALISTLCPVCKLQFKVDTVIPKQLSCSHLHCLKFPVGILYRFFCIREEFCTHGGLVRNFNKRWLCDLLFRQKMVGRSNVSQMSPIGGSDFKFHQ
jgi:hypothetical protein